MTFDDVLRNAGDYEAIYVAAGYPPRAEGWMDREQAESLGKARVLIVQDLFPSPLTEAAGHVIPAASWAEKDGTFVNHAGLAQAIRRAVKPPGEVRTDGQVLMDLMGRRGLFHAATVRGEMAAEVPYFAQLAATELGENGVMLPTLG